MELIDKAAVVAEIERRIKTNKECMLGLRNLDYYQGKVDALNDTISFINTFEVKEADLNEEIERCLKKHSMLAVGEKDFTDIAKHFYELGLQSEKDLELTWEDLAAIEKIGDDFFKHNQTPMSDEEFYKEVLKRFKERKEK